ncbi:MAG: DUF4431 domain-containing protein [Beijerinckiaceae bacterium]
MRISVIVLASAVAFAASPLAAQCLSDTGKGEVAEGRLALGQFKDAADRPETAYILTLSAAVCLNSKDPDMRVKSTRRIHVFSSNEAVHKQIGRMTGKPVRVRGAPFGAHTAHHHAPIVMDVSAVEAR